MIRVGWVFGVLCALAACGGSGAAGSDAGADRDAGPDPFAHFTVEPVAVIPPGFVAAAIAPMSESRVAVALGTKTGSAFCPDCVDLDPSECPKLCERTELTLALLDTETQQLGKPLLVAQSFPLSFDHDVNQVAIARLDDHRVGYAWLECDNSSCGFGGRQSCTAKYRIVDVDAQSVGEPTTLYSDWYGDLQLVANESLGQVLAVLGKPWGAFGTGVRATIFSADTSETLMPWTAIGGADMRNPAASATSNGFMIAGDDPRPSETPPTSPCAASCECSGSIGIEADAGGLYAFQLSVDAGITAELVMLGLTQDGHLAGGHYHDRQVVAPAATATTLVIAATQAIRQEAEIFVRNQDAAGSWSRRHRSESPIPLWLGVLATDDEMAWLGSQPAEDQPATVNSLVAGVSTDARGVLSEPLDSYVFAAVPWRTPTGVTTTFLLRGIFNADRSDWEEFEIVRVSVDW